MRAVDTNVLVRLLTRDDPVQVQKAEAFISDGAWVSGLVLAECVWVLDSVYELDKPQLRAVVAMLLEHERLILQDADVVRSALESYAGNRGVGFTDCMVVALARKNACVPLGTFDRKLAKLANAKVV